MVAARCVGCLSRAKCRCMLVHAPHLTCRWRVQRWHVGRRDIAPDVLYDARQRDDVCRVVGGRQVRDQLVAQLEAQLHVHKLAARCSSRHVRSNARAGARVRQGRARTHARACCCGGRRTSGESPP